MVVSPGWVEFDTETEGGASTHVHVLLVAHSFGQASHDVVCGARVSAGCSSRVEGGEEEED